jgi:hypothetical protein
MNVQHLGVNESERLSYSIEFADECEAYGHPVFGIEEIAIHPPGIMANDPDGTHCDGLLCIKGEWYARRASGDLVGRSLAADVVDRLMEHMGTSIMELESAMHAHARSQMS